MLADSSSAAQASHKHGPPSAHHAHQLLRLCTSMGHRASIMSISCSGFARARATKRASGVSAAQALHKLGPPSKHHEHQLLRLCTSTGPLPGICRSSLWARRRTLHCDGGQSGAKSMRKNAKALRLFRGSYWAQGRTLPFSLRLKPQKGCGCAVVSIQRRGSL